MSLPELIIERDTATGHIKPFTLRPIYSRDAFAFIDQHHRHHPRPQGWLFGTSAIGPSGELAGVICVGRTTARKAHNIYRCEATRVCVLPGMIVTNRKGERHAASVCSMLYAAAWRAAREIGFTSMRTYLLEDEPAITVKALKEQGWRLIGMTEGGKWDRPSRARVAGNFPECRKQIWEVAA